MTILAEVRSRLVDWMIETSHFASLIMCPCFSLDMAEPCRCRVPMRKASLSPK